MVAKFTLETSSDYLTSRAGLILVGKLLAETKLFGRLNRSVIDNIKVPLISNADNVVAYLGLLCQGKSDFDHIEPFRQDRFFAKALGIRKMTSAPTLRQRFDQAAPCGQWQRVLLEESADLLKKFHAPLSPIPIHRKKEETPVSYMPLDLDVSPFDNSGTQKEGVSRTYKGFDGYSPFFGYLGQEGYCVNVALREGKTNVQKHADDFIDMAVRYAKRVTDTPLLLRMDGGNDAADNINYCLDHNVDFLIKRNPRKESPEKWLAFAKREGRSIEERAGKTVYWGSETVHPERFIKPVQLVYHVTERTAERDGQLLLVPEIELNLFWTTLTCEEEQILALYKDHATSEQFHSEIKSELDLERLPSGKFDTNDLVLHLGAFAYNLLRLIGQIALTEPDAPTKKKKVFRQRIRTVIQDLMLISARFVTHARTLKLCFGRWSPWFPQLHRIYRQLS
ncbi:IS1380 family transposase [Paenibacillus sp. Soil522]|uniref:IS1380 family transposase n=1 Tax=Paenibacillus sp. Soil522 TaxID=1736388 RepID=UPI0006F64EA0|nr:IS1380 family transposase [Paenibacillus sp. Soil522]KRE28949.1 transposase [Paenibacillus sp. Soil522]